MTQIISEYLKKMTINGRSSSTVTNTANILKALDSFKPIEKVKEQDLVNFFDKFKGAESSKNLYKIIIKKFYNDIGKPDYVDWIRTSKTDSSLKEDDILSAKDINKLLNFAPNSYFKALIAFLYESGCRIGEAKSLKYNDLKQTTDGYIVSIKSIKTKNGFRKIILPMSTQYIANLKLESCAKDDDIIFGYMPCYEREKLHEIGIKAAIGKPVTPHKFRHARATEDARCGYSEQILKKKFGWTSGSKMVDRYTHLTDDDVLNSDLTRLGKKQQEFKPPEEIEKAKPISIDQAANRLFEIEDENRELKERLDEMEAEKKKQQDENDFILRALKAKGII